LSAANLIEALSSIWVFDPKTLSPLKKEFKLKPVMRRMRPTAQHEQKRITCFLMLDFFEELFFWAVLAIDIF